MACRWPLSLIDHTLRPSAAPPIAKKPFWGPQTAVSFQWQRNRRWENNRGLEERPSPSFLSKEDKDRLRKEEETRGRVLQLGLGRFRRPRIMNRFCFCNFRAIRFINNYLETNHDSWSDFWGTIQHYLQPDLGEITRKTCVPTHTWADFLAHVKNWLGFVRRQSSVCLSVRLLVLERQSQFVVWSSFLGTKLIKYY